MKWTEEQQPIVVSEAHKLLIQAGAGSGKTTTLRGYSEHHPQLRILYICYNKSVELAARGKFPRNVVAKTAHGLAYAVYGTQFSAKQANNLRLTDVARAINTQDWELARDVVTTLNNFMASADDRIGRQHFPRFQDRPVLSGAQEQFLTQALRVASALWTRMTDPADISVQITHDGYLKLYQVSKPDLSQRFDCILLDEAQDVNPVIADIARIQKTRIVAVGDPHQQIYRFRGAEDALSAPWMANAEKHYLTQCFRFGPAIAHVANVILSYKGETRKLQGMGDKSYVKKTLPEGLAHRAYIHRTVSGVIENALALIGNPHAQEKIFWVGGIDSYSLRDLEDLWAFSRDRKDLVQNRKLLRDYRDYGQYQEIAEITQDVEMLRSIRIITTYPDLPVRILALRSNSVNSELDATVTLTSAHKSKGLEWEYVALFDDFNADPLAPELDPARRDDELNLLYVSVTRAMKILAINSLVLSIMEHYVAARELAAQGVTA